MTNRQTNPRISSWAWALALLRTFSVLYLPDNLLEHRNGNYFSVGSSFTNRLFVRLFISSAPFLSFLHLVRCWQRELSTIALLSCHALTSPLFGALYASPGCVRLSQKSPDIVEPFRSSEDSLGISRALFCSARKSLRGHENLLKHYPKMVEERVMLGQLDLQRVRLHPFAALRYEVNSQLVLPQPEDAFRYLNRQVGRSYPQVSSCPSTDANKCNRGSSVTFPLIKTPTSASRD